MTEELGRSRQVPTELTDAKAKWTIDQVQIGDGAVIEKTVSESDVYLFSGLTGDFSPNHINERYMQQSMYGQRIAQGALIVGLTSAVAAEYGIKFNISGVAAGYDHLRFTAPVFFGDTIRVTYEIATIDAERSRTHADLLATNQRGETVLVGQHILKYLPYDA